MLDRRAFLASAAGASIAGVLGQAATGLAGSRGLRLGAGRRFRFDELAGRARSMARAAYAPPPRPAPDVVQRIGYEAHGKIRFRRDHALYADGPGAYPATFFHLGRYFPHSVRMYAVQGGTAREILYSPAYFDVPAGSVARQMPSEAGFAGFRLHESRERADWKTQDWVAFLGASYFRAIGALGQYGLSARGVALNTAAAQAEEFPAFTELYIQPAMREEDPVHVYALLSGPSIAGAYRFALWRNAGVVMDVEAVLFLRRDVARLGVAPLTSMFWYGEYDRPRMLDWRPEVHDSDGLALWTGGGERLWRPLNNPPQARVSSFLDGDPKGFGLLQRDRDLGHYLDGVRYERRPSLWVEPLGGWDAGAVQLVELPTDDEIHDNIVAFWTPEAPALAGNSYRFAYRLHWLAEEPYPPAHLARTAATRIGRGGEPGKPRPDGVQKFVIEFAGGALDELRSETPTAVITASRGKTSLVFSEPVPGTRRWRAHFDLHAAGGEPVDLRLYLRLGDRALSETWLYQHFPDRVP